MRSTTTCNTSGMAAMRCYWVERDASGAITGEIVDRDPSELPPGDVTIAVEYSSLNYKDALAATGHPGVVRNFPHIPGIDAAGTVLESTSSKVAKGQQVLVTGYQLGSERWGGWSEQIRVPAEWVIPLPSELSTKHAMTFGTAGFTAAQGVDLLQRHQVTPDKGEVIVTGATGGVGCLAIGMLARLGYRVVAVSGKPEAESFLKELGAAEILPREALADDGKKPLLAARWAGAVDTIGGAPLAHIIRSTQRRGCVTCCGMLAGAEVPLSVFPFILRGVTLAGIDSAECPTENRPALWKHMADDWRPAMLDQLAIFVDLDQVNEAVQRILRGEVIGRTVVRVT
jgi:acrylyl-CoA reductase (NADPH)